MLLYVLLLAFKIKLSEGLEKKLTYCEGDLVTYNEFEASKRGKNKIMLVVEKFTRLKSEGAYYRVVSSGQLTICHESQIQRVKRGG